MLTGKKRRRPSLAQESTSEFHMIFPILMQKHQTGAGIAWKTAEPFAQNALFASKRLRALRTTDYDAHRADPHARRQGRDVRRTGPAVRAGCCADADDRRPGRPGRSGRGDAGRRPDAGRQLRPDPGGQSGPGRRPASIARSRNSRGRREREADPGRSSVPDPDRRAGPDGQQRGADRRPGAL